jgi:hypothetical protein
MVEMTSESVAMRELPVTLGTNARLTVHNSYHHTLERGYRAVVVSRALSGQAPIFEIRSRTSFVRSTLAWKKALTLMFPRIAWNTARCTKHDEEMARHKHSLICRPVRRG